MLAGSDAKETNLSTDIGYRVRRVRRTVIKRIQYILMRNAFPIGPREWEIGREGARVFANSMPKAGTNLLSQLLRTMPNVVPRWTYHVDETLPGLERQLRSGRRGQVVSAHLPWSREIAQLVYSLGYDALFMVRDPRDIAVSNVNYVTRMDLSHPLHPYLAAMPDDASRLLAMIEPTEELLARLPEVWRNDGLRTFLPWLDQPDCLIVRFEDLVGEKGGGSHARQRETIAAVARHLRSDLTDEDISSIAGRLFGSGSRTFHKGQIGNWRKHFRPEHKMAFKTRYGSSLIRMGYETDLDW